jgi:ATP-dependent Clp protease ATP-binding subunit ClpB
VDDIVIFHALNKEHLKEIIEIQLGRLRSLLAGREISVELTDTAKEFIIEQGYDPAYGARPLKRTLQRRIQDPMALHILQGDMREGDHVVVDRSGDQLIFSNNQQSM